jgi:damage-control phosphatase, subfamily I
MKTHLDCIPCFCKQALAAARLAGASSEKQKEVLDNLAKVLLNFPLTISPPEMAREIYGVVSNTLGISNDVYKEVKDKSNKLVLSIYDKLKNRISNSSDHLLTAVELAIAGNIIDYGAKTSLNIEKEIEKILSEEGKEAKDESKLIFDYPEFKSVLERSKNILYLADNAGEVVFDRLLIEELTKTYKGIKITYAVKEKPIINDALAKDAYQCGVDKVAKVVSSGSDAAGTVLSLCSREFLKIFAKADMIISKGQGNFEALSGEIRPMFFLFKVKCSVVAQEVNGIVGDMVLYYKK